MITDIYIKHPDEPGYEEDSIIQQTELQLLLAQIKMTLMTANRSVLGESDYGINEDNLLFDFSSNFDKIGIENSIRYQLREYCTLLKNRNWDVSAHLVPDGTNQYRDAVHIMVTVDKDIRFVIAYD
jgi:hypothetical protein